MREDHPVQRTAPQLDLRRNVVERGQILVVVLLVGGAVEAVIVALLSAVEPDHEGAAAFSDYQAESLSCGA